MDINKTDLAAFSSRITPIGLQINDLSLITKYDISIRDGKTTHTVELVDGGHADITFNPDGTAVLRCDGMLTRRFIEGGSMLGALSEAQIDEKGHVV